MKPTTLAIGVPESEFDVEFVQMMANRMSVSFFKYGKVADAKGKVDEIASLEKRLQKYRETGNAEWLVDVANFAMIEFMHKRESFRATDSHESPGLVYNSGEVSARPHTPNDEQKAELVRDFYDSRCVR
jgi:hypothetical protein